MKGCSGIRHAPLPCSVAAVAEARPPPHRWWHRWRRHHRPCDLHCYSFLRPNSHADSQESAKASLTASHPCLKMGWRRLALLLIAASACLAPLAAMAQPSPAPALAVPEQCYRIHSDDFNREQPPVLGTNCQDDIAKRCQPRCRTAIQRVSPAAAAVPLPATACSALCFQKLQLVSMPDTACLFPPSCSWATSV